MLRKIILPLVLLVFAQQDFYGMKEEREKEGAKENNDLEKQYKFWLGMEGYMNGGDIWFVWAILDNVPFQYGNSKIWKHGEAYYGLSNGIGFFPSFLNFGWLKIGIGDAHINVINTIIKFMKTYTTITYDYYFILKNKCGVLKNPVWLNILKWWLFYTIVTDIHLFSFKFFNCVKIKILSIGAVVTSKINGDLLCDSEDLWCFPFNFEYEQLRVPGYYFILSPRIELDIPGIINYLSGSNK